MRATYELSSCPACGVAEHRLVAGADELRRELESLWEFHLARVKPDTPPGHLHDRTVFSQDTPLQLVACASCGTLFRNPRETERALVETYAGEPLDETVLEGIFRTQSALYGSQMRRFAKVAGQGGAGIEVGSYVGGFLQASRDGGWQFEGVDVNEQASHFARARGFIVHNGSLDAAPETARDAVAIWNCFDQLPDPRAALRAAHTRLRPGGTLALRVPNGGFYAALRKRAARGSRIATATLAWNNLLGFPYRHGFTPLSLKALVEEEGFDIVRTWGDALAPLSDDWTLSWARREEHALKTALRLVPTIRLAPWFELYARRAD